MQSQNRSDWAAYDPAEIPTKAHMPHVEQWASTLPLAARVLDVGCGADASFGGCGLNVLCTNA